MLNSSRRIEQKILFKILKVRIYFVYLHMKINISSEKLEELISKG